MRQPLIFTELRLLPRSFDILLTLIAWGSFLWLIYVGMVRALVEHPNMGPRPFVTTLDSLAIYLVLSAVYGGLLIIWARYNQYRFRTERRSRKPGLADDEVAKSFHISPVLVGELNKARLLTVHHNQHGEINQVDPHVAKIVNNVMPMPRPA